jgi:hypothetical protein
MYLFRHLRYKIEIYCYFIIIRINKFKFISFDWKGFSVDAVKVLNPPIWSTVRTVWPCGWFISFHLKLTIQIYYYVKQRECYTTDNPDPFWSNKLEYFKYMDVCKPAMNLYSIIIYLFPNIPFISMIFFQRQILLLITYLHSNGWNYYYFDIVSSMVKVSVPAMHVWLR